MNTLSDFKWPRMTLSDFECQQNFQRHGARAASLRQLSFLSISWVVTDEPTV